MKLHQLIQLLDMHHLPVELIATGVDNGDYTVKLLDGTEISHSNNSFVAEGLNKNFIKHLLANVDVPKNSAYPTQKTVGSISISEGGLTKLEYFAGLSMQSMAHVYVEIEECEEIAKQSFDIAEAMMKESKARQCTALKESFEEEVEEYSKSFKDILLCVYADSMSNCTAILDLVKISKEENLAIEELCKKGLIELSGLQHSETMRKLQVTQEGKDLVESKGWI